VAFLEPSHIVDHCIGSGLDAAMIAVDGFMSGDLVSLKPFAFLLGGEQLDILAQRALVALEGENVIGFLVEDFLGDVALAADGVGGNDGAFDHQHVEKAQEWR